MENNKIVFYNLFGLVLESSIALDYLRELTELPDAVNCVFELGDVHVLEDDAENSIVKLGNGFKIIVTETDFYLDVYEKFSFSINDKNVVHLELKNDQTVENALPYFYGTVLTFLLHLHFKFPIHCSGSLGKQGLSLFCARSGTGKSTLAVNLHLRGHPIFTDDKCVLQWNPIMKKFIAKPSIRAIRLHHDTIEKMTRTSMLKDPVPIQAKEGKFQFNLDDSMLKGLNIIHQIFIIRKVDDASEIKIVELKKSRKMTALYRQLHRPGLVVGDKMKKRAIIFIRNLAVNVPVFLVQKPAYIPIGDFVDFIELRMK